MLHVGFCEETATLEADGGTWEDSPSDPGIQHCTLVMFHDSSYMIHIGLWNAFLYSHTQDLRTFQKIVRFLAHSVYAIHRC